MPIVDGGFPASLGKFIRIAWKSELAVYPQVVL